MSLANIEAKWVGGALRLINRATKETLCTIGPEGSLNVENSNLLDIGHKSQMLIDQMRSGKGGKVGTNGKGAISLRFDDYQDIFKTDIWPLLQERCFPASMALISRFNSNSGSWANQTSTWSDIVSWNRAGLEIWDHSMDHSTYSNFQGLYDEVVTSKNEIEANDIKVMGFAQPGTGNPLSYNELQNIDQFDSTPGRLLVNNYALSEAYASSPFRALDGAGPYHGLAHVSVGEAMTLDQARGYVDIAERMCVGIELMCHPGSLGLEGNMTLVEFTTLLDYIKTKVDAGTLEILTPSSLCFADKSTDKRLNLITDGSFENAVAGVDLMIPNTWYGWTSDITLQTGSGKTGSKFAQVSSSVIGFLKQRFFDMDKNGWAGQQFKFTAYCKPSDGTSCTARVIVQDYLDTSKQNLSIIKAISGSDWTKMEFLFGWRKGMTRGLVGLGRAAGASIDWDDVSVTII